MRKVISVSPAGVVTFVKDDAFTGLAMRGHTTVRRASHVVPAHPVKRLLFRILRRSVGDTNPLAEWSRRWRGDWQVDLSPSGGPLLGPFPNRRQAIEREIAWLNHHPFKEFSMKITPEELAERMKQEILTDVKDGTVPCTVASFSELHDYVDANCYGGTEDMLEHLDAEYPDTDEEAHMANLNAMTDLMNPAMDIVDQWIKGGGLLPKKGDAAAVAI